VIELGRRELLQGASALGLTLGIGSYAAAQRGSRTGAYLFFKPEEADFVEAAVDRLIPRDPDWPGAGELGVPSYIDLQLSGPYGNGDRLYLKGPIKHGLPGQGYQLGLTPAQLYRTSLAAIARRLKDDGMGFKSAGAAEQDAFLTRLERGEINIDGFSSAIFFETLLANTIEGYFGDPAYGGNRDMMSWRMIGFPGAYAAYLDVYTQHGIRFHRAPIAMSDAAHHLPHAGPTGDAGTPKPHR
jgi:gluconate 2-dehydrogenase gamma chain